MGKKCPVSHHGGLNLDCSGTLMEGGTHFQSAVGTGHFDLMSIFFVLRKIFAIDINEERCKTMDSMLKHFGATCCEVVHEDFLKISPDDEKYSGATHILVDPTCTGSGVTGKLQNAKKGSKKSRKKTEDDKKRLQKLKSLQVSLLKHALSFPRYATFYSPKFFFYSVRFFCVKNSGHV